MSEEDWKEKPCDNCAHNSKPTYCLECEGYAGYVIHKNWTQKTEPVMKFDVKVETFEDKVIKQLTRIADLLEKGVGEKYRCASCEHQSTCNPHFERPSSDTYRCKEYINKETQNDRQ